VQAAERFADGGLEEEELRAVWSMACDSGCEIATVAAVGSEASAFNVAHTTATDTSRMAALRNFRDLHVVQQYQCDLMRDLFGPLLFRPITVAGIGDTALRLARSIYAEHDFGALPILADVLEEDGVTDVDVLNHLREPGRHTRGCWALDLLLRKE
jgi:hypothetical protein